jgi:hypothetical protein
VQHKDTVRYELLKQINGSHELFIMINTSIDMYQSSPEGGRILNLAAEKGYQEAEAFLKGSGYTYCLKKTQKEFSKTLMGFSTGRTELRSVALMAVAIGKGQLRQDFFNTLGCSHDLMIGIGLAKPSVVLLEELECGKFDSIDQSDGFSFTLIDSQWLGYIYTDFDPAGLE